MIADWRVAFGQPDLPFYWVQLPNFTDNEANTPWRYPVVRQAQLETMRTVPNTGMAITLDLGEAGNIHPKNKHDVGERLARWALSDVYGRTGFVKCGPIVDRTQFRGNGEVRIVFDTFGSALRVRDASGKLAGFEMAGADGGFHPATALLDGDAVVVMSSEVDDPRAVRYAWKNNATDANLVNAENWPASPFHVRRD